MHFRFLKSTRGRRLGWRGLGLVAGSLLAGPAASGAIVNFVQDARDDSTGTTSDAVVSDQWLETALIYSTAAAPASWGDPELRFIGWTVSGATPSSLCDAWGRSLDKVSFVLLENTTATAHYLPLALNTDSDGLADWHELEYFGSLVRDGSADFDGDGLTDAVEFSAGSHPLFPNQTREGGVSRAQTELLTCNFAGFSTYRFLSEPAGLVNETGTVIPGTVVSTPDLSANSDFAYWTLDGVRQQDAWGRALDALTFAVGTEDRTAIAFILAGDGDEDGLPDAWEQRYLATLERDGAADPDDDGRTLLEEYSAGSHPGFPNTQQDGGVSFADSASVTANFAGFSRYTLTSDPAGLIDLGGTVIPGASVTSPEIGDPAFAQWTLDGERQQDAWGVALRQITFTVADADRAGVALYLAGDSDGDGLPDAWEQFYLGGLTSGAEADDDGDGRGLLEEYTVGTHPKLGNHAQAGGVSHADSDTVVVNLQFFDRLSHVLVEGVLSELFSTDPHVLTGWSFGPHAAPAAGDWDGDGRSDIFVASDNALWVLQNTGSAGTPSYTIASSAAFGDLAALCAGVARPMLALGDWNGDGRADLVLGGSTNLVRGLAAAGNFHNGQPIEVAFTLDTGSARSIPALGDVNGDGRPDLLLCLADGSVQVYLHTGDSTVPYSGTPVSNWLPEPVPDATGLACADITGDGAADIVVADSAGRIWEFHRIGASYLLKSKVWAGSGAGFADELALALTDLNGDGHIDVLGGTAQGGLIGRRDPRLGAPAGLELKRGGHSITLSWESSQQSRIRGYFVYRQTGEETNFTRLTPELIPLNRHVDEDLAHGIEYRYQVTSVAATYLPGNSTPRLVESPPSATASQTLGGATVKIRPTLAPGRGRVRVHITLESTRELAGEGMDFRLRYDPAVLTPLGQAEPDQNTVHKSGLAGEMEIIDNGETAAGELHIQATAGDLVPGQGVLLDAIFVVSASAPAGVAHGLELISASLQDTGGNPLAVELPPVDPPALDTLSVLGDLTGDGVIDDADADRLGDLLKDKDASPTAAELEAGDLNGDGRLDQGDLVMLRRELAGKKNTT